MTRKNILSTIKLLGNKQKREKFLSVLNKKQCFCHTNLCIDTKIQSSNFRS